MSGKCVLGEWVSGKRIRKIGRNRDIFIDELSFCPTAHKLAGLTNTPCPTKILIIEVNILRELARKNNVNIDIRMIHEPVTRHNLDLTTSFPVNCKLKTIRLPFLGKISSELSRNFRPLGFRPVYYNPFTLKYLLVSAKERTPKEQKCGVYQLDYADCPNVYIGAS